MISSMLEPTSRFSKTVATGIRVPRNTHAPLRLSATLSTAGHCDQSSVAIPLPSLRCFIPQLGGGVTCGQGWGLAGSVTPFVTMGFPIDREPTANSQDELGVATSGSHNLRR